MNSINIKTEQLDSLINKLESHFNNIQNLFSELDNKMVAVSSENDDVWKSPAQSKMYEYYTNIKKIFPLYENKFSSYIMFLKSVSTNYQNNEKNSFDVMEINSEQLNINGGA